MRKARDHKLSMADEQNVLYLLESGLTNTACAERFGVGQSTIIRIKKKYRPSVPAPSSKVKVVRRRHRKMDFVEKQLLFHRLDGRAKIPVDLTGLARHYHTSQEVIREAIASRKKLVPVSNGHFRNESESENDG